jgi:hypothetical protein
MFEEFMDTMNHTLAQACRKAIAECINPALFAAEGILMAEVCQWPERRAESVYFITPGSVCVRVRIDVLNWEELGNEPGIEAQTVLIPNDVSDLVPEQKES